MMNPCRRHSSSFYSLYGCLIVAALAPWVSAQNRTTVQLEYQLDVNFTSSIPTVESAVIAVESSTKSLLLELMAKNLGASTSSDSVILSSSLQDPCWDPAIPSDACYTVSTEASILVPSNINPAIVKLATTNQKVQGIWMSDIVQAYPNVLHVESLPTTPSTSNEVDASLTIVLHNVAGGRIMNDYEIGVFEETVMTSLVDEARNFNVSYFSIHAVVVESQTLVPASMRRLLRDLQSGTFNNIVNASVAGNCNGCTSNQFHQLIDDTVNSPNFQKKLQQNGKGNGSGNSTAYFNSVNQTSVAISSLSGSGFSTRASNNGGSASAATASSTDNGQSGAAPFELWVILAACVGLVVAILVVLLVLAGRRRRRRAAEEDEMEGEEVEEKDYRREHRRHSNSYNNKPSDDVTDEDDVY